jgi:hypothetical protein
MFNLINNKIVIALMLFIILGLHKNSYSSNLIGTWIKLNWTSTDGNYHAYKRTVLNSDSTFILSADGYGECTNGLCWDAFGYSITGSWHVSNDTIVFSADTTATSGGYYYDNKQFGTRHYPFLVNLDTLQLISNDIYGGSFNLRASKIMINSNVHNNLFQKIRSQRITVDLLGRMTENAERLLLIQHQIGSSKRKQINFK